MSVLRRCEKREWNDHLAEAVDEDSESNILPEAF
jgi:hypothetical protein